MLRLYCIAPDGQRMISRTDAKERFNGIPNAFLSLTLTETDSALVC